jgi:hypothetical protein
VSQLRKQGTIDSDCVTVDATKLKSRERAKPKKTIKKDGSQPDWGSKKDSHGNQITWFGWKIHLAVDCKNEMPLAVNLTLASRSDSMEALPLVEKVIQLIIYFMCEGIDPNVNRERLLSPWVAAVNFQVLSSNS